MSTVLLTDYAWPDLEVEKRILAEGGLGLASGPSTPAAAEVVENLVQRHRPAAILTCWAPVSARAIGNAPDLKIVVRMGVGLDNIAVDEASARGIWVANVPDYCVEEVSDHAVGMLLAWARGIVTFDRDVKAGRWEPAGARLRRVTTLTIGVLGYGRIARRTAEKVTALGASVCVFTRHPGEGGGRIRFAALDAVLSESDALIVHLPLTSETHHFLDRERIAHMRPGALLVNVSRGAVVDTEALVEALERGHLSGAALDVVEGEPHPPPALASRPDVILTPHVGFSSLSSLLELRTRAVEEVVRVLRGERPRHPCNRPSGVPVE